MYYSTDPVHDAARYWARQDAAADERAAYVEFKRAQFLAAALAGDMRAAATWAPTISDLHAPGGRRQQTVGEVLWEALDYNDGPHPDEALALLCAAAKGKDVQQAACALIERMACTWAEHNTEKM